MKVNSDKIHFLMSRTKALRNIDNDPIESEDTHELFGITVDSKLTCKTHINKLCKKASQKQHSSSNF